MSFQIHDPHDPFKEHFNTRPNVARLTSIKQWDNFSHGINDQTTPQWESLSIPSLVLPIQCSSPDHCSFAPSS